MENYINKAKEKSFKEKTLECNICKKIFFRKASLTFHLNSHSAVNTNVEDEKQKEERETQNVCNICCKKFTAKKNLLKHLRDVHKNFKEAERMVVKKIKCPIRNCQFICRMMKELRDHIEECHNVKILKDTLQFPNETDFQKWKKEEETNTVSWFVTGRKKTTLTDGTKKQILCCHRTGQYNPKGFGKYRMRSVGSCKIGVTCPAAMEVREHSNGQMTVDYYKTHLGHRQDVVYLKLSREERENLAEKIERGFSLDAILEDVKESNDSKETKKKRIHLLSKKDLYSIMRTANNNGRKFKIESKEKEKLQQKKMEAIKEKTTDLKGSMRTEGADNIGPYSDPGSSYSLVLPRQQTIDGNTSLLCAQKVSRNAGSIAQGSGEDVSSQIVILSPDIDCTSVAEIILLSTEEDGAQSLLPPQNRLEEVPQKATPPKELTLEEKNLLNKSNLRFQLKNKVDKITELLPKSEFLTPKQFDLINAKLDGILNIFDIADSKAKIRKKNCKKKTVDKDDHLWVGMEEMKEGESGGMFESSPLVYAVYN